MAARLLRPRTAPVIPIPDAMQLYTKIFLGLILGVATGVVASATGASDAS